MAYAFPVARVTLFGQMLSSEEWSTGFYLGATGTAASPANDAFMTTLKAAWQTFFTTAANGVSADYNCTGVKVAIMGTDGKTDLDSVNTSYYATPINGGSTGTPLPPQCALVATLVAGDGRGLAGKGRMYLPGIRHSIDGGGHINSATTQTMATNLKTFFNALNASAEQPGQLITASKGRVAPGGAGPVNRVVTAVRVGNVYDTQRRRRNALVEQYSSSTLT